MNYQRKITKAQVESIDSERERIARSREEISNVYFRLDTKHQSDKSLYAVVEMLDIVTTLLAQIVQDNQITTKEK